MEARSLKFVADACAGERLSGSPETRVHRVCTDSRQVQAGDLFFAMPGERFDGHDFCNKLPRKGPARSSWSASGCRRAGAAAR